MTSPTIVVRIDADTSEAERALDSIIERLERITELMAKLNEENLLAERTGRRRFADDLRRSMGS